MGRLFENSQWASPEIDVNMEADDLKNYALSIGLTQMDVYHAFGKAMNKTLRTLKRISIPLFVKHSGIFRKYAERRIWTNTERQYMEGRLHIGLMPASLSHFQKTPSVPRSFHLFFKKGGHAWFLRRRRWKNEDMPPRGKLMELGGGLYGKHAGFKSKGRYGPRADGGRSDRIVKLYSAVKGGYDTVENLDEIAGQLLKKNVEREIDQFIRKKTYAK
jgi:hypothetical protein